MFTQADRRLLDRVANKQERIMAEIDDLKASIAAYSTKVNAYVTAAQTALAAISQQIADAAAKAVAEDDAAEAQVLNELKEQVDQAAANVPEAPGSFEPSNQ